jgi:hypothetical protein
MPQYEQHPMGKLFPPLGMEQAEQLAFDIAAHGLHNPITLFEGQILDGWNRYNACKSGGVLPKFVEFQGDDPALFVISQNINRRHLSITERVMLAKQLLAVESKRAAQRQKRKAADLSASTDANKKDMGKATAKVAKAVGVSASSVERAITIEKSAIPEVQEAVESGVMSLREAARVAKLPKAEQATAMHTPKATKRRPAPKEDSYDLAALKRTWVRADGDTRESFFAWVRAEMFKTTDPIDEEPEGYNEMPLEDRWQNSAASILGDILARRAYWDRLFGKGWEKFEKPTSLVALAKQAVDEFAKLANALQVPIEAEVRESDRARFNRLLESAKKKEFQRLLVQYHGELEKDVKAEFDKRYGDYNERLEEREREVSLKEKAQAGALTDISSVLTYAEFKSILTCLHPDQAERTPDKLTKAFQVFKNLETTVHLGVGTATLRKRGGWEHLRKEWYAKNRR